MSGIKIINIDSQIKAGKRILKLGPKYVLVKGGHGESNNIVDALISENETKLFESKKIKLKILMAQAVLWLVQFLHT